MRYWTPKSCTVGMSFADYEYCLEGGKLVPVDKAANINILDPTTFKYMCPTEFTTQNEIAVYAEPESSSVEFTIPKEETVNVDQVYLMEDEGYRFHITWGEKEGWFDGLKEYRDLSELLFYNVFLAG